MTYVPSRIDAGALEDSYIELFKARDARAARLWEYAEILYSAGKLTIDDVAKFVNDVLTSIDQIAYDLDKGMFSTGFIAKVLENENLSIDRLLDILYNMSITRREEILRNFTSVGVTRIFEEGLTLDREDKFDLLDASYWTHNEGGGNRTIDTSRYVSPPSSLRISRGSPGDYPYHDDVGHDFGVLGDGSIRVYIQEDGAGDSPCGSLILEDAIHGNAVARITVYPDSIKYAVEGTVIAEEEATVDTWYEIGIAVRKSMVFFLKDGQIRYSRNLKTYTQFKAVRLGTAGYDTNEFFDDYKAYR